MCFGLKEESSAQAEISEGRPADLREKSDTQSSFFLKVDKGKNRMKCESPEVFRSGRQLRTGGLVWD